ncbi:MAG: hypothetical protein WED33_12890 [Bacteroidia bacterium]
MNITIKTIVKNTSHTEVMNGFNKDLFEILAPPFPPFELDRFDGCTTGDEVHLKLNFLFFKQAWNSLIISHGVEENKSYFVDKGFKLPFFLSFWEHHHIIEQVGKDVKIVDDIHFKIKPLLLFPFVFPGLFLVFLYRKPVYKRRFSKRA